MNKLRLPKFPKLNWKLLVTVMLLIVVVVVAMRCVPNFMENDTVKYEVVATENIPEELTDIIGRYKMLERALATKIDDEVYVIVTRGEKLTAGYGVDIEKIELVEEENESKLVVYAVFTDPKPDELVAQVITYPYAVAKTDLKELPQKIELQVRNPE
ncbi:protease complex subunit PrcB family protein [Alkaliphilus hydrothermalis]|uniref:PrcB C-terminal domain-containing protein n=1 Tax=Alkaliphilus hydrothermalis TaxID=1482730 RepID=A0ABS2NN52_9FIRM|nr:hypothetical protein [Alkaliphilus hydrothermalis]